MQIRHAKSLFSHSLCVCGGNCYFSLDLNENVIFQAQKIYILLDSKFIRRDLLLLFSYCVRVRVCWGLCFLTIFAPLSVYMSMSRPWWSRPYRQLPFRRSISFALYRTSTSASQSISAAATTSFIHSFISLIRQQNEMPMKPIKFCCCCLLLFYVYFSCESAPSAFCFEWRTAESESESVGTESDVGGGV